MKRGIFFIFCIYIILSIFLISGVSVGDNIPVQIQTTDDSGNIITGTFNFTINISNSSTCSPVLYSNTTTKTTDARGIVSYNLENVSLDFNEQYWFCYYRDSVLKQTTKIARTPYAFRAKNITLSGVEVDSNFNLSSYNFTTLGWVGIGTTSPERKLHVNSTEAVQALFKGTNALGSYLDIDTDAVDKDAVVRFQENGSSKWMVGVDGNDSDKFKIGWVGFPNTRLTITSAGDVGIGTMTPSQKLQVEAPSATASAIRIRQVGFQSWDIINPASTYRLDFVDVAGGTTPLTLKSGGNVGIGTTSPNSPLEIYTLNDNNAVTFHTTATGTGDGIRMFWKSDNLTAGYNHDLLVQIAGTNVGQLAWVLDGTNGSYFKIGTKVDGGSLSEKFRITNAGNVGIGTVSPAAKLQVLPAGNSEAIRIANIGHISTIGGGYAVFGTNAYSFGNASDFKNSEPTAGVGMAIISPMRTHDSLSKGGVFVHSGYGTAGNIVAWSDFTPALVWDTSGKVGIGTTTPRAKLDIIGGSFSNPIYSQGHVFDFASATGVNANRYFKYTSQNTAAYASLLTIQGYNTNDDAVDPNSIISLQPSGGNVGIGTTSPWAELSVKNNISVSTLDTSVIAEEEFGRFGFYTIDGHNYESASIRAIAPAAHDTGDGGAKSRLQFYTTNSYAIGQVVRMTIDQTGNVGIGTTAPYRKLEVNGELGVGNTTDGIVMWMVDGIGKIAGIDMDSGGYNDIEIRAQAGTQLYLKTDGNVGIGTTTPSEKLEVNGTVHITSLEGTYSNGEAYVCVYNNGTIFAKDSACS